MAVLAPPIHVRGDTVGCMRYIQNPEKTIQNGQSAAVMRYMQSHCVEDAVSVGYNGCSGVRDLAVEQFRLAEASYKSSHPPRKEQVTRITVEQYLKSNHKTRLPKHIKPDEDGLITVVKGEVTAEHLVISAHKEDHPSPALLQAVVDEFMQHPHLQGFPALSNLHWNTDEPHAHILISCFASDGSRKLSLSGTKLRELRRHLDRICYEHGLSIIDTREARLDPEHSEWLDKVKAEGRVKVRAQNRGSVSKGENGKSWKASKRRAEEKLIEKLAKADPEMSPATRATLENQIRNGWFLGDGKYLRLKRSTHDGKYYHAPLYVYDPATHRTRQRSLIELIFILARIIITGESDFLSTYHPHKMAELPPIDRDIQAMIDSISTARDLNVKTPKEIYQRTQEVGAAIGDTRRTIAYDEKTVSRTELYKAISMWNDKTAPQPARNEAYAMLSAFECTSPSEQRDALKRKEMAEKRLSENRAYLQELTKSYRRLKNAVGALENANARCEVFCSKAREAAEDHSLANKIAAVEYSRQIAKQKANEAEQNKSK